MKTKFFVFSSGVFLLPLVTSAQTTVWTTMSIVFNLLAMLVEMGSTLAVLAFFYGLANFILVAGNEEKRKKSRTIMTWGILAMFVMVTIWGILGFMQNTLGNYYGIGRVDIVVPVLPR